MPTPFRLTIERSRKGRDFLRFEMADLTIRISAPAEAAAATHDLFALFDRDLAAHLVLVRAAIHPEKPE